MKKGLVLEGGAMRGVYTAGVLDVFLEHDIEFDGLVGVSAGTVHGCSYVAKQKGRSIRYYMKYHKDYRFMSWKSFFKTGNMVDTDFCYDELPNKLDKFDNDAFEAANTKFYVTVTNCESGEAELIKCDSLRGEKIHYIRASASMPFVSHMVELDGNKYLDGGIGDSIPIMRIIDKGYDKNIVVLTRPFGYRKKPEHNWIARILYHRYPKLYKRMARRYIEYNETIDKILDLEEKGEILVLRPSKDMKIGRMEKDTDRIKSLYDLGREDAKSRIEEIKRFLCSYNSF